MSTSTDIPVPQCILKVIRIISFYSQKDNMYLHKIVFVLRYSGVKFKYHPGPEYFYIAALIKVDSF